VGIARNVIGLRPVDAALVSAENRRKKVLVADMDSTMIEQECIDELADAVGIKAEVAAITERAMNGELDSSRRCARASASSRASSAASSRKSAASASPWRPAAAPSSTP
jgi:phosphoserine phosphatase